jgi:hypothetical protein
MGLLASVSYGLIARVREPLAIGRSGVSTFELIYVGGGQRTLASVEGVSHVRERCESGGPSSVDKLT